MRTETFLPEMLIVVGAGGPVLPGSLSISWWGKWILGLEKCYSYPLIISSSPCQQCQAPPVDSSCLMGAGGREVSLTFCCQLGGQKTLDLSCLLLLGEMLCKVPCCCVLGSQTSLPSFYNLSEFSFPCLFCYFQGIYLYQCGGTGRNKWNHLL